MLAQRVLSERSGPVLIEGLEGQHRRLYPSKRSTFEARRIRGVTCRVAGKVAMGKRWERRPDKAMADKGLCPGRACPGSGAVPINRVCEEAGLAGCRGGSSPAMAGSREKAALRL